MTLKMIDRDREREREIIPSTLFGPRPLSGGENNYLGGKIVFA